MRAVRRISIALVVFTAFQLLPSVAHACTPSRYSTCGGGDWLEQSIQYDSSDVYVDSYYRRDGTYVQGHWRTAPDDSFWNNYSSAGNINPYTGAVGTRSYTDYLLDKYSSSLGSSYSSYSSGSWDYSPYASYSSYSSPYSDYSSYSYSPYSYSSSFGSSYDYTSYPSYSSSYSPYSSYTSSYSSYLSDWP